MAAANPAPDASAQYGGNYPPSGGPSTAPYGSGAGTAEWSGSGSGSASGSGPTSGSFAGGGFWGGMETATRTRAAHGILAAVAMVALFPTGAVFMRILPGRVALWTHAITQIVGLAVFVGAVGLGLQLVSQVRENIGLDLLRESSTSYHAIIGFVVLGCLVVQPVLGLIHHEQFRRLRRRQIWSYLHLFNGRIPITLGIVNGGLGLWIAGASGQIKVAYVACAAVMWTLWMLVALWAEWKRWRKDRPRGWRQSRPAGNEGGIDYRPANPGSPGWDLDEGVVRVPLAEASDMTLDDAQCAPAAAELGIRVNRSESLVQDAGLLTLIITTSPTPSAPSTELLSQIVLSFHEHCPELTRCRVILVLDTYDHISSTARLKKGHVTADGAAKYAQYKKNAKRLILDEYATNDTALREQDLLQERGEAEFGSTAYAQQTNTVPLAITKTDDGRIMFIEPLQRLGFGLAVRSALRLTETPYVWIQQHDWVLISQIPLRPLLAVMQQQSQTAAAAANLDGMETVKVPIKYVCFPSVRMAEYARSDHVMQFPALRALTYLHKQNFTVRSDEGDAVRIPLTPLFFWHDKPHVAETEHYRAQVFPSRVALPRGAFIEDTIGHRARTEMKDGLWKKWACWLYYPDEGKQLCMRHLKGRTWRGAEGELAQKLEYMRLNQGVLGGDGPE
ncbi:hypothetical protein N658DRAFT_487668 [Parathielavia hyrcaniae]|uniref:Cytochrome b561 domain-containing protein n=1 Tax=Parathielavia hyrcaniae TaxID=113614 RepID=A0AAN6T0C7_9PEZI|nr:hypothetical protein N658DRAFT_487668 [Parathielavia hyrcaniae]